MPQKREKALWSRSEKKPSGARLGRGKGEEGSSLPRRQFQATLNREKKEKESGIRARGMERVRRPTWGVTDVCRCEKRRGKLDKKWAITAWRKKKKETGNTRPDKRTCFLGVGQRSNQRISWGQQKNRGKIRKRPWGVPYQHNQLKRKSSRIFVRELSFKKVICQSEINKKQRRAKRNQNRTDETNKKIRRRGGGVVYGGL